MSLLTPPVWCHVMLLLCLVVCISGVLVARDILDVAVIGGGPGGLATALAAKRALGPDSTVGVFERSPELLEIGGQVGLMAPAFNALDAIDPSGGISAAVEAAGVRRKKLLQLNDKGVLEGEIVIGADAKQVVIPWFLLQRALAGQLPSGVLHLGYELEAMEEVCTEEGIDCIALTFGRGKDEEKETRHARLVIGADGNLSKTRALLFGEEEEFPAYAGSAIWRMFIQGDFKGLEKGISKVWSGDGKVLAMQKMGDRVYLSGQAAWPEDQLGLLDRRRYIGVEDGEDSGGRSSNAERLQRFATIFKNFPQDAVQFAVDHCETSSVLEHPIYYREPNRPWGRGRATLIGDAAHCIPPNMAMGTPLAFEDAAALGYYLAEHGVEPESLRAFESERMPRVNTIATAAIEQTGRYYKEKDDKANPFKLNDTNLFKFIMDFKQSPVPSKSEC